jgi:bifunctional UDP-N-acetylglucosamine pyrophosphorylase/glucosamine-1-phosphate N-acetyltransferase
MSVIAAPVAERCGIGKHLVAWALTMPNETPLAIVILAAGKGTRMKSDLHKVLHPIAGRAMIEHLMASVAELVPERQVVVAGYGREQLAAALGTRATIAVQDPQHGTAHAVQMAEPALADFAGDVMILYGDVPFVSAATMRAMLERLHGGGDPAVVVLGFDPEDALQYGRVIAAGDRISKMVEFKDASDSERACRLCNSGLMAVRSADLFPLLARVGNDNAQGEFYLPDVVNIALADGRACAVVITSDPDEVAGINSRAELAEAEERWQIRRRRQAMDDGASLIAPETVWFSWDTVLGRDVLVEPNVVFGPGVTVADSAKIRAFCHIEGATLASGTEVGPYARLRPGAVLEEKAKVGNFVEVKKSVLGKGAKANHLSYIGDADVGAGANIGAGTITCNYDGYFKYKTVIGERAFIGSNSALVAPVKIGADAIVAAGSAVTRDVAAGELRIVRAEQLVKPGWADRFHDAMKKKKAEKKG